MANKKRKKRSGFFGEIVDFFVIIGEAIVSIF